ncbi:receptor-type tyrosine-protein phosphatase eta-like isoform X2 [Siniperca chuatsi]|uniref:receptor-type tyrosine-protein phosphatase eta-like isoform X2 n=1 Tax=Siniperca chuatsi TaxID=119488 RepID=UPI001CE1551B|nr:receptor-type tyrosine-protein phosphatase eta-like isoform X2 [Siniperca chuatsi]
MAKSLKDKVYVLICWALMLMYSAAEREYFWQSSRLSWTGARNHCQVCFKELVTLTPENIQTITCKLTSGTLYWVGLRKNFSSTSNSTSMSWSRWANGDPLAFQNWYPGWPVFKSSFPKRDCCSCSCTCPTKTTSTMTSTTGFTEFMTPNVTGFSGLTEDPTGATENVNSFTDATDRNVPVTTLLPVEAACVRSPMLLPDVPDTDKNYIEDSCVAMLSFGAWVEKNCSELLPFICYEDRFIGQVNVANVTNESAVLTWLPGPGNISHYRLEVKDGKNLSENLTDLTYDLVDLTAGTKYFVQVFPVKCDRNLNPQEVAFYTTPNKVENLKVTKVTETSVSLSWNKAAGNVDFYLIQVKDEQIQNNTESKTEGIDVNNLIPGSLYTFTVKSGVQDKSRWSEESNITKYTKPAKVSNLMVSNNTNDSLQLSWMQPVGKVTGFRVVVRKARNASNDIFLKVNETKVTVTGLPMGTEITLSVTALTNCTEEGDNVTVVSYTAPGPISNLNLFTTHDSLNATWMSPESDYSFFTVKLQLDGTDVKTISNVTEPEMRFDSLKSAANYTVIVYKVSGHLKGPPVESSNFTLPLPPTLGKVTSSGNQIMIEWNPPVNTSTVNYSVKISSSFWGHNLSDTVNNTNHTFSGLKSGTKYYYEVRTLAGVWSSTPLAGNQCTDAVKRDISLSMLCSSAEPLLCDHNSTKESVFVQLHAYFNKLLGDNIFWELTKQDTEN